MNKYLFLDIDGVLNHEDWYHSDACKKSRTNNEPWYFAHFDPECIKRVHNILEKTGAKLIVSSSWRTMADLKNIFNAVGMPEFFSVTPYLDKYDYDEDEDVDRRGMEIEWWLRYHDPDKRSRYVILDDDKDILEHQLPHFVQTCSDNLLQNDLYIKNNGGGLTDICMNKCIDILNNGTI